MKKHQHTIQIVLAVTTLLFFVLIWRKKRIDEQLEGMITDDDYEGQKIKKGTRIYINADDTLPRVTVINGNIDYAKYINKTKDFKANEYIGKYVGRYGKYAHIVLRLGVINSYYVIHNARIKTL